MTMLLITSIRRHNMWTTMCLETGPSVDNRWLSTANITTHMQDVAGGVEQCEVATVGTYKKYTLYPQSTGLITVIKSSYKHPHLTIHNVTQGEGYEIPS